MDFADIADHALGVRRRAFLTQSAYGLGGMAFASLADAARAGVPGVLRQPHAPVRAKRVIFLCMAGGPSHLETFDWKPKLKELDGKPFPESFTQGQQLAQLQNTELKARGAFCEFKKWGQSGQEISGLFPNIGGLADDLCIIRSMQTEQINHDTAHAFMNTGSIIKGRPSMGSWLLYGLGCDTSDLPGFVVLTSAGKSGQQPVSARQWSAGILPSKYQGIQFQSKGQPVHYLGSPDGVCQSMQRQVVEEVARLNGLLAEQKLDPEIQTRVAQYEMAFKMQASVPELTDMKGEPPHILDLYGVKEPGDGSFASNCLLARRLAERGVRMIQLYHRAWDHHGGIVEGMKNAALDVDRATAGLIRDLKQRGLLEDTLILWGGEFGRTPMGQGSGRDHHILAFNVFLAGGGVKPGMSLGATDELGYRAVQDVVHVHDLHATMLHLLGIDHKRLNVKFQGLDVRLTGVAGRLVKQVLA
ncbi:MAG TPA: sulfatase [Verrucomicrobiales bacterium]|nr:sulfatase [Verrucomicrobiales bacterium]